MLVELAEEGLHVKVVKGSQFKMLQQLSIIL